VEIKGNMTKMAKKKAKTAEQRKTTAQQLGTVIKSARDIMRKCFDSLASGIYCFIANEV
jgi:hypothetical protein